MRTFLIGAAALLIAAGSPAFADNNHHGGGGGNHPTKGAHMGGGHPSAHPGGGGAKVVVRVHTGRPTAGHARVTTRHVRVRSRRRHVSRGHGHVVVRRGPPVAVHVDVSGKLHHVFRATRRFHAGLYNRPFGWYSYDWRLGQRLPRGWFVREYWIGDWGSYGLFAPPEGLVWVRVGPDALLINEDSGEVVAIYNDLFW